MLSNPVFPNAEVLAGQCEVEHQGAIAAETTRRLGRDGGIAAAMDGPRRAPSTIGSRTKGDSPQ